METEFYHRISDIYNIDTYFKITLDDGVNIYTNEDVNLKKYNIAYKIYLDEKKNKDLEYIDLRFKDIAVK